MEKFETHPTCSTGREDGRVGHAPLGGLPARGVLWLGVPQSDGKPTPQSMPHLLGHLHGPRLLELLR